MKYGADSAQAESIQTFPSCRGADVLGVLAGVFLWWASCMMGRTFSCCQHHPQNLVFARSRLGLRSLQAKL